MGKPGDPVDVYVGQRIRERRKVVGLSQQDLAQALGLSFQQVQKYERGGNRLGVSRLLQISRQLNAPVSYFFERYEAEPICAAGPAAAIDANILSHGQALGMVRSLIAIEDDTLRHKIMALLETLAERSPAGRDR